MQTCLWSAGRSCKRRTFVVLGAALAALAIALFLYSVTAPPSGPATSSTRRGSHALLAASEASPVLITLGSADGGAIRPLLGVGGGPLPPRWCGDCPDLTEEYHAIGVTMIRTHDLGGPLDMSVMYPDQDADPHDPGSYDFEASDRAFAAIVENGFEPYLRLGDSMGSSPGFPPLEQRAPVNPDNWTEAAIEVVRHYDGLSRQAGVTLRYVEIWNEPNYKEFWDASPREFYELFADTAAALKAEFPYLMIGGPGLASSGGALSPEMTDYTERFLDYLEERGTPLDFLSWHVYSSDADVYAELASFYRQQLDAHGYTTAESHITEWNTSMRGEDGTDAVRNTARGASLMSAAWIALEGSDVSVSTFYRGNENRQTGNMGLFYPDGRIKPIALAFSLWAKLAAHPERLATTVEGGDRLRILAGEDQEGEIAVLIVNPTGEPSSWEVEFAPSNSTTGTATLYQVSDSSEGLETISLGSAGAGIGAYTVQLLVIGRNK